MRNISETDDAAHQLMGLLAALGRRNSLRDPLAQVVESLALTPPQLHTLMWLGLDGALPMGELARRVGVTEKTITGIIDRLEREEYVQRERDAADRRVIHVRLSARGQQTAAEIHSQAHEHFRNLLDRLDPEDRTTLLRIFEKLVERLGSAPPPPPESL